MLKKLEVGKYYIFMGERLSSMCNNIMLQVLDGKPRKCTSSPMSGYVMFEGLENPSVDYWCWSREDIDCFVERKSYKQEELDV